MNYREWKEIKLEDVIEIVKKPYHPNSTEKLPYIGLEHIEQQSLRLIDIGNSDDVISQKNRFYSGDILFGKLRPYFRKVYQPKFDGVCSTDIWVVRAKKGFSQKFLFFFLASQSFIDASNSGSSGTRMPRADWGHLSATKWYFPSLLTQERIANILSALDDKIELNRQENATLEAMAQAIFKEWFVDFNFPGATGEMVESELGMIPKGWRVGVVGEVVRKLSVGKKYDSKTALDIGNIPILDQSHFSVIGYHNNEPGIKSSRDYPVVVFSNHRCYTDIIHFPFSAIQNVLPMVGKNVDTRWLYCATKGIITYSEYKGHWPDFISKKLIIPPVKITLDFGKIVKPLQIMIYENIEELKTLAQIRDALLPKLMNGEIEV